MELSIKKITKIILYKEIGIMRKRKYCTVKEIINIPSLNGLAKSSIYRRIRVGKIPSIRLCNRIFIPLKWVEEQYGILKDGIK